jgi:hypothetical protein
MLDSLDNLESQSLANYVSSGPGGDRLPAPIIRKLIVDECVIDKRRQQRVEIAKVRRSYIGGHRRRESGGHLAARGRLCAGIVPLLQITHVNQRLVQLGHILPESVVEDMLSSVKRRYRRAGLDRSASGMKMRHGPPELSQELTCMFQVRRLVSLRKPSVDALQQVRGVHGFALAGP